MQLKLKSFFNAMAFCMSLAWKTSKHYTIGRCTLLILSTCTPYISMFLNKILIDSLTIINEKNYFSILFILILVMLMAIITKLFSKLSAYYQNIHSDLLEHEIEKMVMKKTMKTNIEFYDSPEYLNTLQAVMTDFFSLNEITWNMLERSTDLEKESSGAYAGEASVIYVYEVLYKITGKQKYLEYAEKHCKILEYALKADENNDLIYGNAGAVIVLLNLYHLAQKDIYLQLACEAGNILIKNQNKGKWCCGNGQSLSGLSHGITGIIYALTKLNNEQFHIEYQKAIHSGLIYENTMYSDKYNNWLDNREEAKKEENSDNRCMAAWCHGAPGILLARSKMYNLVKDSSDYITVQCDIERALFATKMYGFTDNDCLCHGNLGNTEILLEYSKECNDEEVRHMMLSARTQIAMDIINENYDCARSYLHGYKIPGFMTGISGMGYSLLRDLYPELPCILALEI